MKNFLILIILSVSLAGCVGPLVTHETARSVGDGNHELLAGYGNVGYILKWNYGVSENFDIGFQLDAMSMGIRAKYAFINRSAGFSMAGALGYGSTWGGNFTNLDILASYKAKSWEPYTVLRYVTVSIDEQEFTDEASGDTLFEISASEFNYGQFMLGTRYWMTEKWLLSLEASMLFSTESEVDFESDVIGSLAVGYKF